MLILYVRYVFSFFFFKQKTAYEMRISDWSSDVCSSDLLCPLSQHRRPVAAGWKEQPADVGTAARLSLWPARPDAVAAARHVHLQIGRASCRERVCQYV